MTNLEFDGPQPCRLLTAHNAQTATVAQGFIDCVLVVVVGRIVWVDPTDRLPLDRVPRAELLTGKPVRADGAVDIEVGRTDVAASAVGKVVDGPNGREWQHALGGTTLASLDTDRTQAAVDTFAGVDLPGIAAMRLDDQE